MFTDNRITVIHIKRLFFIVVLGAIALFLSILPKEKKSAEGKKYLMDNTPGNTALIPTARADDGGAVGITSCGSCSCGGCGGGACTI